jgi:hypothetical protein
MADDAPSTRMTLLVAGGAVDAACSEVSAGLGPSAEHLVCVEAVETVGAGVASGPAEDELGVADGAEMTMIAIGTPIWTGCGLVMVPTVLPYVEHPVACGDLFSIRF